MPENKYLKITQKGFESYNGPVSVYEFKDGVSVEPIPPHHVDRIAASFSCVEVTETGKETVAGVSERLVTDAKMRAPNLEKMKRQSVEEKVSEEKAHAEKVFKGMKQVRTEEELDAIINEGGIKALREVAEDWNVKNKSIPALRQMILDAQDEYVAEEGNRLNQAKVAVEKVVRDTADANRSDKPLSEEKAVEKKVQDEDILTAAATGNLTAAISAETDIESETSGEISAKEPSNTSDAPSEPTVGEEQDSQASVVQDETSDENAQVPTEDNTGKAE